MIEVRRMGTLELRSKKRTRLVDAYAVFVDGREQQPWLQRRQAEALRRKLIAETPEACGWCGSTSGTSDQGDGWPRCNECRGC